MLEFYRQEVIPKLSKEFGYGNVHQVPKLTKIVVNVGLGEATANPKLLEKAAEEMALITGQKPVIRKARKSIANFKLREGQAVGCTVTLRRERMWEFFDRLVNVALPRVRDFKGLAAKAFDGRGNFSLGIREQIIFPEIEFDKIDRVTGMNVTLCTTARNDAEGRALLAHLGVPFRQ
jgi:large subunit ribosomal protein L5